MQSNDVDIYYYQDEPGLVFIHPFIYLFIIVLFEMIMRAHTDLVVNRWHTTIIFYILQSNTEVNAADLTEVSELSVCVLVIGLVPEELENGDAEACSEGTKLQDLPPCWGLDIVCGKGTDFNYGPWADRQRYAHT